MDINLTAPRSWKELDEKQLVYISWLLIGPELTEKELQAYAFVRFTGIRILREINGKWICQYKKRGFTLSAEQVASFCRQFSWLTGTMSEVTPLVKLAGRTHVDPRLRGVSFMQYIACENYYQAYIFTKEVKYLDCLCACFYTNGASFSDNDTVGKAKAFAKVPLYIRHTVFLWYYGLKSVLEKEFPHFFQRPEIILDDELPTPPNMRKIISNMIRTLSGGDITKTEAIYYTETWTALAELDAKALEYREYEKRMSKYKK